MQLCQTWWVVNPLVYQVLMIVAGSIGNLAYPKIIEEMDGELNKVIEDFNRAVYVEALRIINETSKLSCSRSVNSR